MLPVNKQGQFKIILVFIYLSKYTIINILNYFKLFIAYLASSAVNFSPYSDTN